MESDSISVVGMGASLERRSRRLSGCRIGRAGAEDERTQ